MIQNIYDFALVQAAKSNSFHIDALCRMCNEMPEEHRKRFIEAILGIVDIDAIINSLPISQDYNGHDCSLYNVNYLLDEVQYSYEEEKTLYFNDPSKANHFSEDGSYEYYGNEREDETHTICVTHKFTRMSTTTINSWRDGQTSNKKTRK